jgi:hypothetical protein
MSEPKVDGITFKEYIAASRKYHKAKRQTQRLGQYLCNSFNINMSKQDEQKIFYEEDNVKVIMAFSKYITSYGEEVVSP